MIDIPTSEQSPKQLQVRDFYLGRQPILDRSQSLFGYEMLFRASSSERAAIETDLSATAGVIAHVAQLGLDRVIGDAQGFLNVDAAVLASDIFVFLPREKVVLELVETMPVTRDLLDRIGMLRTHGFRFALDNVRSDGPELQALLPLVDYIKMDLRDMPLSALTQLTPRFRQANKKLVAEKVESREQYQTCMDLGFDYFQGYFFAKPSLISGRKLSPSQLAILDLMSLVSSDADNIVIERAVKRDVTLALNLLRLVNTPAVGAVRRIDSLSQAVTILGRRQLQRWLQIMLYAEPAQRGQAVSPLLSLATTRGRILELLAQRMQPTQRAMAEVAFTVGIMSLMDVLFSIPMDEILEQIPVSPDVAAALLRREGFYGNLLRLAESIEQMGTGDEGSEVDESSARDDVTPALRELQVSANELADIEMTAFAWSDTVVKYAL